MNNAIFACENCGYQQELEAVHAGKEFSCPTCSTVVTATPGICSSIPQKIAILESKEPFASDKPVEKQSNTELTGEGVSGDISKDNTIFQLSKRMYLLASTIPNLLSKYSPPGFSTQAAVRSGRAGLLHVIHSYDNPLFFIVSYVFFMLFAYLLPSPGFVASINKGLFLSASWVETVLSIIQSLTCVVLILICLFRGLAAKRIWLAAYPALLLLFSCTPRLAIIPYIPSILHGLAIILGLVSVTEERESRKT